METKATVRRSFCRRSFFRQLGSAALIAGPLLRAHRLMAAGAPKVVLFYVGGGMRVGGWQQTLTDGAALTGATLTNALAVFEKPEYKALKSRLTVFDAAYFRWAGAGVGAHSNSALCSLAAASDLTGRSSLDRELGRLIGGGAFPSLRLKVVRGRYDHSLPSVGGSASLSASFADPATAYAGIFAGVSASSPTPRDTAAPSFDADIIGQSLTECLAVVGETQRQLGKEAGRLVQDHCDSLRDLERRIQSTGTTPIAGCNPGRAAVATAPAYGMPGLDAAMDVYTRIAVNALACDRTRVVLYELWGDQPEDKAAFLDSSPANEMIIHRALWHGGGSVVDGGREVYTQQQIKDARVLYYRFLMERFARLLKQADDLQLLDDTIVLWVTNEPFGNHSFAPAGPCFYAGKGGGKFTVGKYLTNPVGINDVFTSLLRGVTGKDIPTFGEDGSGRPRYGVDGMLI